MVVDFYFRQHADVAIDIITRILPHDHLLLASSKRVKGLSHHRSAFICLCGVSVGQLRGLFGDSISETLSSHLFGHYLDLFRMVFEG